MRGPDLSARGGRLAAWRAIAATAALAGCSPQADVAAEGERLMQTSREWSQVAQSRDVERILRYWADDAVVIVPGQPERRGKAAIREYLEQGFAVPGFRVSWEPLSATVSEGGDLGYLIERTEVSVSGPDGRPLTQHYRAVTVWRREADGAWRNVVDISSEAPAPPR